MGDKVIATMERDSEGVAVLLLENLQRKHIAELREVMMRNGTGGMYDLRAEACAHLDRWSPEEGVASIRIYGERTGMFLYGLRRLLDMEAVEMPYGQP